MPARLPEIRLLTETWCAPIRPVKGALMRVWSRSNCASRTEASALLTAAWAARCSAARWPAISMLPYSVFLSESAGRILVWLDRAGNAPSRAAQSLR